MNHRREEDLTRAARWAMVFFMNLITPVLLGIDVVKAGGLVGMIAGVVVLLLVSTGFVIMFPKMGKCLISGGTLMMISQLIPVLQMMSGLFALRIWQELTGATESNLGQGNKMLAEIGGFTVTLMTAQPLLLITLLMGAVVLKIQSNGFQPVIDGEGNANDDSAPHRSL
jgi:hypothetical protein